MTGIDEQLDLFNLIGRHAKKKTECYVIGGSAMLFYGFKNVTKDVDLVFTSENDRSQITRTLKEMGFATRAANVNNPLMLERKEDRLDLFVGEIITTLLSHGIMSRIKEKHEFSNLVVNVISPEDIIVLKCATDREGDRKDAADIIANMKINWDTILEEAKWQAANGKKAFVILLYDFVEDLMRDYKADVPQDFAKTLKKEYKESLIKLIGREKFEKLGDK